MTSERTTFGTQTDTFEVFGGQEGVVTVRDACGEVLTALSDAEAVEFPIHHQAKRHAL